MNHEAIKPCPHCGGIAYLNGNYSRYKHTYFVFVKCDICGAQGKIYNSDTDPEEDEWINVACDSAVKAWNMRTPDQLQEDFLIMALTPIKAIRAKCMDCSGGQRNEVKLCTVKTCSLYPYRMGHRPKAEDLTTNEEKTENEAASRIVIEQEGVI